MFRVKAFTGEYRFLSNFYRCLVGYENVIYRTLEHAYQASKTISHRERLVIYEKPTAAEAKRGGQGVTLREDWEDVKYAIMYSLVLDKFTRNRDLKTMLLKTGNMELIEGNWWGDTYWGVCNNIGNNYLGKILMEVRIRLM